MQQWFEEQLRYFGLDPASGTGLQIYHHSVQQWALVGVTIIIAVLLARIILAIVRVRASRLAGRDKNSWATVFHMTVQATTWWFLAIIAIYAGLQWTALPDDASRWVHIVLLVGVIMQVALWGSAATTSWVETSIARRLEKDAAGATTLTAVGVLTKIALWSVALLLVLDNLGVNVTALIAGLGIGGIAVALAAQNVLSDLFASLSIVLDKPFVLGDFIIVGEEMGTVERIGLKTTRIRSLSGEQLIFSNGDLLQSRIRNFRRMQQRRATFSFGVTYKTPPDKLAMIGGLVESIIRAQSTATFDRAHFLRFADSALQFDVVYHVTAPDFQTFADTQQAINLAIIESFEKLDIEFAYPTQTLFLRREAA